MAAVNYARNKLTRELIFVAKDDAPPQHALVDPWLWWRVPTERDSVRLIGEGMGERCYRLKHWPRECTACKVTAAEYGPRR